MQTDRIDLYQVHWPDNKVPIEETAEVLAIRWVLDRGDRLVALWGARSAGQLDPCQEAFGWKLSDTDYAAVDQILAETIKDPVGPDFMAPPE